MKGRHRRTRAAQALGAALAVVLVVSGCSRPGRAAPAGARVRGAPVIAVETFLADFARQVSGGRLEVRSLIPAGVEPHGYEPTPKDIAAVNEARMLIVNGAGLEGFLAKLLANAGGTRPVVEASAGLSSRTAREGEAREGGGTSATPAADTDPHFWLDPVLAVRYVQNIRDGFITIDPAGEAAYRANADAYIGRLKELDLWIRSRVAAIPPAERLLVTNHESLGYFADRYGFRIIGTVIPSVSTEASPTARQLARLVDGLKASRARAVFIETGANPQLARQVAEEAGIRVVTELYTHSLSEAAGPAPDYLVMMRTDVNAIVGALAGAPR
jgi:ABC-type Zn uptake system ZnuABC Zn-binding protein ZnuA